MAASLFDSAIYRDLYGDAEAAKLFTDTAEVRAMMLVEGALAKVQGRLGLIPETAAAFIHRGSLELQLDPAALAAETGRSAVPVPALVKAFREAMQAPEHAQWLHYGATSQDILDTGLVLRLRPLLALAEERLTALLTALARLARDHAALPMPGRTYGQVATPTSFGAVVAGWGRPLLTLRAELPALRERVLQVSLAGAAGTLSAMGAYGAEVRAGLAEALDLRDPGGSWHADRSGPASFVAWAARVTAQTGRMGEDLILLTQSGIGEVRLPSSGGSSTMPQKQNPVQPSVLAALARQAVALDAAMQGAAIHRQQRDAAAWMTEWLTLPQLSIGLARALATATGIAEGLTPQPQAMAGHIDDGSGLIYAEALSFRLATTLPRPEAQEAVKALCKRVTAEGRPLQDLAAEAYPDTDLTGVFSPAAQLGTAPAEARAFADAVEG